MTLKLNRGLEIVEIHVRAKYRHAECCGLWIIVYTNVFALSRDGKESENPVLWPWPLTYDFQIQ